MCETQTLVISWDEHSDSLGSIEAALACRIIRAEDGDLIAKKNEQITELEEKFRNCLRPYIKQLEERDETIKTLKIEAEISDDDIKTGKEIILSTQKEIADLKQDIKELLLIADAGNEQFLDSIREKLND